MKIENLRIHESVIISTFVAVNATALTFSLCGLGTPFAKNTIECKNMVLEEEFEDGIKVHSSDYENINNINDAEVVYVLKDNNDGTKDIRIFEKEEGSIITEEDYTYTYQDIAEIYGINYNGEVCSTKYTTYQIPTYESDERNIGLTVIEFGVAAGSSILLSSAAINYRKKKLLKR